MTSSFSSVVIPALFLLTCSSAQAASGAERMAEPGAASAAQAFGGNLAVVVVDSGRRETNLRKSATSIIVLGADAGKASRKMR